MAKKYKITKGMNYHEAAKLNKCISCNGSGYYDSWDYENDCAIVCGSCDGTGKNQ